MSTHKLTHLDYLRPSQPSDTGNKKANHDAAVIRAWTFIACMGMLFVAIVFFAVMFLGLVIFF